MNLGVDLLDLRVHLVHQVPLEILDLEEYFQGDLEARFLDDREENCLDFRLM